MHIRWLPLLLLTAGCSSTIGPTTDVEFDVAAALDQPFDLKVGELAFVDEANLYILFSEVVDDSRCPSHALILCVWEGDAAILIESAPLTSATLFDTLHTTLDPKALDLGLVVLELLRVDPYPETTDPIAVEDYTARFVVRGRSE